MRIFIVAIAVAGFMSFPLTTYACTCVDIGPPCQSYWASPVVFSGRAVDVRTIREEVPKPGSGSFRFHVEALFSVSAEYRGKLGPTVELVTGAGGGDCGYKFEEGREYLVYAYKEKDGALSTGICTPTKPLENAGVDLEFIGSLATAKPVGSVFGKVSEYQTRRSNDEWKPNLPIANLTIELTGPDGPLMTTTTEAGEFRFANLQPGEYRLGFAAPNGFLPATSNEKLLIPEKGCAIRNFSLTRETSISGRLIDTDGEPVRKIFAQLVPIDQINERFKPDDHFALVDDDGQFKFPIVPAGRYYLGIRLRSSHLEHAYPRTFYPGTQILDSAAVVIIREGQILKDLNFQLPEPFAERRVEGVITFPDGKPVARARVLVEEVGLGERRGAEADEIGRFSLTLLEGVSYRIRAIVGLEFGAQRHAHWIDVGPKGPATNLKLVISEPNGNCPRCLR